MAAAAKIVITIFLIVILVMTSLAVTFFVLKERERHNRLLAEQALEENVKAKEEALKDLRQMTNLKSDLEMKLEQLKEEAKQLSQDLENQKRQAKIAIEDSKKKEAAMKELSAKFGEKQLQVDDLNKTLESFKVKNEELILELAQIRIAKQALENKILGVSSDTIQLEKIVVKAGEQKLRGSILIVNDQFGFVIINLGKNTGVEPGTILNVIRDKQIVGKVEIENVYDDMSSAVVLPEGGAEPPRENDIVEAL